MPRGSLKTVCRLQSCIRISKTSPAWPSNRQLSGNTIAARPPGFSVLTTCCTKLSCLLLVSINQSHSTKSNNGFIAFQESAKRSNAAGNFTVSHV